MLGACLKRFAVGVKALGLEGALSRALLINVLRHYLLHDLARCQLILHFALLLPQHANAHCLPHLELANIQQVSVEVISQPLAFEIPLIEEAFALNVPVVIEYDPLSMELPVREHPLVMDATIVKVKRPVAFLQTVQVVSFE